MHQAMRAEAEILRRDIGKPRTLHGREEACRGLSRTVPVAIIHDIRSSRPGVIMFSQMRKEFEWHKHEAGRTAAAHGLSSHSESRYSIHLAFACADCRCAARAHRPVCGRRCYLGPRIARFGHSRELMKSPRRRSDGCSSGKKAREIICRPARSDGRSGYAAWVTWEGEERVAYRDVVNVLTISLRYSDVRDGQVASEAECRGTTLRKSMMEYGGAVKQASPGIEHSPYEWARIRHSLATPARLAIAAHPLRRNFVWIALSWPAVRRASEQSRRAHCARIGQSPRRRGNADRRI